MKPTWLGMLTSALFGSMAALAQAQAPVVAPPPPAPAPGVAPPPPTAAPPAAPAEPSQPAEPAPSPAPPVTPPPPAPELPPRQPAPAPVLQPTPLTPPPPVPAPAPVARASAPPSEAPAPEPVAEIAGSPGKGLTVEIGDKFGMNLRSRFQLRYQLDVPPEAEDGTRDYLQTLNIATARIWLSGYVFRPELSYMLQLAVAGRDYRDGATSPVFDAYLDWKAHRDFNLRAGQFFVPFDRLRTVREFALQMVDRPGPVQELTLDRDAGVVVYSEKVGGSPLAYRAGVFGGGGTNLTAGKEPGFLVMARLELRPLGPIDDDSEGDLERREKPGLAIGAGIAHNSNTNRVRSTTGATYVGGTADYLHLAADLVFKWRGFAAQLEYLYRDAWSDTIVSEGDDGPLTEYTRSGKGWVAQLSYLFEPPIEIVGRLSRNYATDGTDPRFVSDVENRGQEVGAGVNYYFNKHQFKLQAGWIGKMPDNFEFSDGTHSAVLQLDATF